LNFNFYKMANIEKILPKDFESMTLEEQAEFVWFKLFKNGSKEAAYNLIYNEPSGAKSNMLTHLKRILLYDNVMVDKYWLDVDFKELGLYEVKKQPV
jgi:hypothetical protein